LIAEAQYDNGVRQSECRLLTTAAAVINRSIASILSIHHQKEKTMISRISALIGLCLCAFAFSAAQDAQYTRDEVSTVKKKLVNVLDAVGQMPEGYSKERESFNLPTDVGKNRESGLFYPVYAGAERRFGSEKAVQKDGKELQKEYQKKMAEAQAKGDIAAITKLAQEMQLKAGQVQLKAVASQKVPIDLHIQFNSNPGATIDPDAVLFEKTGVIALKEKKDGTEDEGKIRVFFDPVSLKDTKQLSRIDTKLPAKGTSAKVAVYNVTVEFSGPMAEIEGWAKRMDTGKVLSQIDGK
jgi:hypothetical protein